MVISEKINHYLEQFITEERNNRFNDVLNARTRYITVVLEDVFQSHNISAVMRSCDCFGIQDVHLIENRNEYVFHKEIEMGSTNWLTIHRHQKKHNNTPDTLKKLKKKGYRIIATTPHDKSSTLENFNVNLGPAALIFGTELTGISDFVKKHADAFLNIPLFGFTESLNISVSAAITMNRLYQKLTDSNLNWQLSKDEKMELKYLWLKNTIKKSDLLINKYLENNKI